MCSIFARAFGVESAPQVNQYPILANPIRMNDESFSNEFKNEKWFSDEIESQHNSCVPVYSQAAGRITNHILIS